ncbi:hypothetical protein [Streptomyces sp. NBC_00582]|uniref:hypothetical protein n=1 Tax=Streptomyces sp. NBC_00582 TaxID=2975783 RepID=UPI001063D064|nr:hypothetical protein [Streptomyces sp. NBC_00582]WUB65450.1 hypothetical protein OG852_36060 [Streptomyces sp. NBC_00582]
MTTGGARGARAAARVLGWVLLAWFSAAACGDTARSGGTPSASPSTTSPEELCTRVVAHWSREVLDSHTYGDYQSMGLSNGQYDILRSVVDAARAEKKRQGADAADALIDREARAGCADWYRSGGPGEGPWQ